MPKLLPSNIRKDHDLRIRVSYAFHEKVLKLAKSKKMSISELIRQMLQHEINKSK